MNETREDFLEGVTTKDIVDLEKGLDSLKGINKEIADLTDKYTSFRLQLIAISGATFAIYVALQSNSAPQIGFVKYGFISLAISLLLGFVSLALSLISHGGIIWYKFFDFDKSMRSKGAGMEKLLEYFGLSSSHRLYDDDWKKLEGTSHGQLGLKLMRGLIVSTSGKWAFFFGIGQGVMFFLAAVSLVLGLLSV